ncbi:lysine 2,3-aminomutase [Desulfohalobium retbaense]|uniref:L-lysine 2,3-aminomutase n=1 Tax=Desulfohalobium retbaense (strain ATCC 49708 / DSM 5692 / JCM 16813 / HR100) TaxID=485915 RepID=C8X0P1_DESRD|nr:lysine 2,3-aminomutase [Desulfohalobium retbaense]ACV67988.1 lysine 2,3-aminomutase YodO family protein [Desulfohalobium retbaense DSM 5692]
MKIYSEQQQEIAEKISPTATKSNWTDWKWQLRHSISDLATVEKLLDIEFDPEKRKQYAKTMEIFPMSVTPYYLSLIDTEDYENDPVFKQAIPLPDELDIAVHDMKDPLSEDEDSPAPGITHRYPDRVLFHVSNTCSMYCRHCTRKRKVGDSDFVPCRDDLQAGLDYIRNTPQVRDVLLSGGDPFMLPDHQIDWLLGQLRSIEHVEVIRIGSRMPVVLPYRITDNLVSILKKHHPLWLNTHFNHPRELTQSSRKALAKLADAGIPLGNQTVLLAGVNDCPRLMKTLIHKLVQNRVRPYYLYQCDLSEGLTHFRTPVGKGIEIIESLIGHTSGFAVPTYVIDAPGGGGKIPVMPNYIVSWGTNKVILRNYEGVITTYTEPDCYQVTYCDRDCDNCNLTLKLSDAEEYRAIGIEKLLSDWDETCSLTPQDTERLERRDDNGDD